MNALTIPTFLIEADAAPLLTLVLYFRFVLVVQIAKAWFHQQLHKPFHFVHPYNPDLGFDDLWSDARRHPIMAYLPQLHGESGSTGYLRLAWTFQIVILALCALQSLIWFLFLLSQNLTWRDVQHIIVRTARPAAVKGFKKVEWTENKVSLKGERDFFFVFLLCINKRNALVSSFLLFSYAYSLFLKRICKWPFREYFYGS